MVASASACEPVFRVRQAYSYQGWWAGEWLANGEGFVLGVETGYAIARVSDPELLHLPAGPPEGSDILSEGPVPAPNGGDRYFLYDFVGVYDRQAGDWALTGFPPGSEGSSSWGETHEEVWYHLGFREGGSVTWELSSPAIEYPPFEEVAFRVNLSEGCLDLREEPSREALLLDCLRGGSRVVLVVRTSVERPYRRSACGRFACLPETWEDRSGGIIIDWVYVRSEAGLTGWVPFGSGVTPHSTLTHD